MRAVLRGRAVLPVGSGTPAVALHVDRPMAIDDLPLRPPVRPMLARLVRELPIGDYLYEPKWDGFRAIAFVGLDGVELQSRHGRPFGRYFPELLDPLRDIGPAVVDGEILVTHEGRFDFERLMLRTHPAAARVRELSAESPAAFVAFDLLADGEGPMLELPFGQRRRVLETRIAAAADGPVRLTPATRDRELAAGWLRRFGTGGADGIVAKDLAASYEPGRRTMLKVKLERTADCVVAGLRVFAGGGVASLLLGLFDDGGELVHVGVVPGFSAGARVELARKLAPRVVPLDEHPWRGGFGLARSPLGRLRGAAGRWQPGMSMDWVPIHPLVAEVAYDTVDAGRFRHPARFRRWRPDREPASCRFDQLASDA